MVDPESQPRKNRSSDDNVGANGGGNKSLEKVRGLIDDNSSRVCNQYPEIVEHLVAGCAKLANTEYLIRHNPALMILAVEWAKQQELVGQEAVWYEQ